jgi:predicted nucleic acid-binding protein
MIVDSSAILAILLREPDGRVVFRAIEECDSLVAPALLPYEVTNGLRAAVVRRRLDHGDTERCVRMFLGYPWAFDIQSSGDRVLRVASLAAAHDLSTYDASYLELSVRQAKPLVTLDASLRKAARAEHVLVLPKSLARG